MALRHAPVSSLIPFIAAKRGKLTLKALAYCKKKKKVVEKITSQFMSVSFSPWSCRKSQTQNDGSHP